MGFNVEGFQDVVFYVVMCVNDYFIIVWEMFKNLRLGKGFDYDYEYEGEVEYVYLFVVYNVEIVGFDIKCGFGVLLEVVVVGDYLKCLENVNFDFFKVKKSWKFFWLLWQVFRYE